MIHQQDLPPNYFYHHMPNGIEMIGQYMPSLSSITFGFQLNAGVINEPEDKLGLAHLFEYMLFQGTKLKDARALNDAFESLGARKGASSGMETGQVWAQIVNTKFDATLDLMQEVLLTPTFPQDDVQQMKNIILQEIRRRDDEPMSRVFELVRATFYAGTALARSSLGTAESVRALQRQDVVNFWQERYQPNNVLFAIAGKFDWDRVVARMQDLFMAGNGPAVAGRAANADLARGAGTPGRQARTPGVDVPLPQLYRPRLLCGNGDRRGAWRQHGLTPLRRGARETRPGL